jgi:K(+)-stimulated pyrophosphate-energized sodium pump
MTFSFKGFGRLRALAIVMLIALCAPVAMFAQQPEPAAAAQGQAETAHGGEVNIVLPDLNLTDVGGFSGRTLLLWGLLVSALGVLFGLVILKQLKDLPVHRSMAEVSALIYETCKTYLITQGKFILVLEVFIAVVIVLYFGVLTGLEPFRVAIILLFSLVGIAGSYAVAWFGIRVNTYANSRTAFASLEGALIRSTPSRSRPA